MPKSIIAEGKTSSEAIENGLRELKVSKNKVNIKILEEKKKSFFNILAPHTVKVELMLKENIEEEKGKNENCNIDVSIAKNNIEKFLDEFLSKISQNIYYKVEIKENVLQIILTGEKSERLIGYRGEALNALQSILTIIANKDQDNKVKVILDVGKYKDFRKKTLEDLANKVAKTVRKTGKSITLEPMTAYERKIIHTALQNDEDITTYSIGENDKRRIVISLTKMNNK